MKLHFLLFPFVLLICQCTSQAQTVQQKKEVIEYQNRPAWAQWRSEGQGALRFLMHFADYQKKYTEMVYASFPGQEEFFDQQAKKSKQLPPPPKSAEVVKLGFVGDLMAVPNADGSFLSSEVLQALSSLDLVMGNLETPISQSSSFSPLKQSLSQYNSPQSYLNGIQQNGKPVFDFLTIANNHVYDRGNLGVKETVENLQAKGIMTHGYDDRKFVTLKRKNINFGVTTATWGFNKQLFGPEITYHIPVIGGIAPLNPKAIDLSYLKQALQEMKSNGVDFKIAFLHWGYEFELFPDPAIQNIARELIAAGADLVIGSHPHVLQPYEIVESGSHRGLVFYSMGNLATDMGHPLVRVGLLQSLQIWKDSKNQIGWSMDQSRLTKIENGDKVLVEFADENSEKDSELKKAIHYYREHLHLN